MPVPPIAFDKLKQHGDLVELNSKEHTKYTRDLSLYLTNRRYNHAIDEIDIIKLATYGMSPPEIQEEMESLNSIILPENGRAEVRVFPIYNNNTIHLRYDEIPE